MTKGLESIGFYLDNTKGYFCEESAFVKLAECVKATQEYKNIRVITVDATTFNGAGASSTQELAFALSEGSEYISRLTDLGLSAKDIAKKMVFVFSVGSSYFMEIAKFRAARMLWANVVEAYGVDSNCAQKMKIFAYTGEWNQTVYDSYVKDVYKRQVMNIVVSFAWGCISPLVVLSL